MIHSSNQLVTFCELLRLWLIIAVLIIIFIFAYTKATFGLGWKTQRLSLAFFFSHFFFFGTRLWDLQLLFMHCTWTVTAKFDFSHSFQPISAHRALFMDPQISLFSNFFIKNGSHDTIHIFKNYFATVFSVFSFQFQQNKFYSNGLCELQLNFKVSLIYFVWLISIQFIIYMFFFWRLFICFFFKINI